MDCNSLLKSTGTQTLDRTMLFDNIPIVLTALAIDAIIGDPNWLYRRIQHPIATIGCMINQLDLLLNRPPIQKVNQKDTRSFIHNNSSFCYGNYWMGHPDWFETDGVWSIAGSHIYFYFFGAK